MKPRASTADCKFAALLPFMVESPHIVSTARESKTGELALQRQLLLMKNYCREWRRKCNVRQASVDTDIPVNITLGEQMIPDVIDTTVLVLHYADTLHSVFA